MVGDHKSYARMKDSGVPWLGSVPQHWEVRRGKWLFRSKKTLNSDRRITNVLSLTLRGVVTNDPDDPEGLVPRDYGTYQVFAKDDLVFKLIDLENLKTSRVGLVPEDGILSPAYVRLVGVHAGIQRYYFQQYFDLYQRGVFNQLGAGVRSTLSARDLLEVPILVPAVEEQAAIVRFLDHADRRIRHYIVAKQQLIKLLEEQKQAIVHRVVTRGLDPNVRLKPSGVEWLGDVPEHWTIARAASVCEFLSAKAHEHFVEPDGEHICVTARFVSTGGRSARRCTKNLSPARRGDVLMVMSDLPRGRALARAYLVADDRSYAVNQRVCILRPKLVHPQYLAHAANRHPELLAHDDGFNQTHLPNAAFKIMRLPLPPLDEQESISEQLVKATRLLQASAERATREIELLAEYRTRLIADVVTGKLDVREAAARLPDEGNVSRSIDEGEAVVDAEEEAVQEPVGEEAEP